MASFELTPTLLSTFGIDRSYRRLRLARLALPMDSLYCTHWIAIPYIPGFAISLILGSLTFLSPFYHRFAKSKQPSHIWNMAGSHFLTTFLSLFGCENSLMRYSYKSWLCPHPFLSACEVSPTYVSVPGSSNCQCLRSIAASGRYKNLGVEFPLLSSTNGFRSPAGALGSPLA